VHACALASALRIGKVLVPAAPGALSALGILDADLRREFSRTIMAAPGDSRIAGVFTQLEAEAREAFRREGVKPYLSRSADLRYQGQGFELRVPWSARVAKSFHSMHARAYGYADSERAVEIVTLRVQAVARTPKPKQAPAVLKRGDGARARLAQHRIFEEGRWRSGALYDRALLKPGDRFIGPAVIAELSATTYLPSAWTACVDPFGNLALTPANSPRRMGRA
jgi:N-methylhydantoinase A